MTASNYAKMLKQLRGKPGALKKFTKHNMPKKRTFGRSIKKCGRCGRLGAHIEKYGLKRCRHCFRETATKIGFKKYS
jgi:small subunit ribosomal protein S14